MKRLSTFAFAAFLIITCLPFASAAEKQTAEKIPDVAAIQQTVNINTADAETLAQLKGIGAKKAEAIVAWREINGNFQSVEQLLEIKGIGEATLEANRANIQI